MTTTTASVVRMSDTSVLVDVDERPVAWREAGSGDVVLFLHGIGHSRIAWDRQLEDLSDRWRCVAWDLPGFGASEPLEAMTFPAIADAAGEVGIRLFLSRGSMDLGESRGGLPPDRVVEDRDAILASTEAVAARHHDGDMVHVVVAPCSPFSVTTELMVESAELARKLGLRLHTHLCETVEEQQHCLERFGRRPVEMLEEWGWVGDDVWLAHGIHIDDAEMRILGNAGTGVAHCPSSNARIASGMCRVTDLMAAGCPVGLGVDGVASNEVGGLFPELRQALYTARLREMRPDALMPSDVLEIGTHGGARCLGLDDVGRLSPGMRADLVVWPGDDLGDVHDPLAGLVLGPDRRARHVLVGGKPVVTDGSLLGVDLAAAHRELAKRARRLW